MEDMQLEYFLAIGFQERKEKLDQKIRLRDNNADQYEYGLIFEQDYRKLYDCLVKNQIGDQQKSMIAFQLEHAQFNSEDEKMNAYSLAITRGLNPVEKLLKNEFSDKNTNKVLANLNFLEQYLAPKVDLGYVMLGDFVLPTQDSEQVNSKVVKASSDIQKLLTDPKNHSIIAEFFLNAIALDPQGQYKTLKENIHEFPHLLKMVTDPQHMNSEHAFTLMLALKSEFNNNPDTRIQDLNSPILHVLDAAYDNKVLASSNRLRNIWQNFQSLRAFDITIRQKAMEEGEFLYMEEPPEAAQTQLLSIESEFMSRLLNMDENKALEDRKLFNHYLPKAILAYFKTEESERDSPRYAAQRGGDKVYSETDMLVHRLKEGLEFFKSYKLDKRLNDFEDYLSESYSKKQSYHY